MADLPLGYVRPRARRPLLNGRGRRRQLYRSSSRRVQPRGRWRSRIPRHPGVPSRRPSRRRPPPTSRTRPSLSGDRSCPGLVYPPLIRLLSLPPIVADSGSGPQTRRRRLAYACRVPTRVSAGILLFRRVGGPLKVLLGHPGGPFFGRKDLGNWSIPKGETSEADQALELTALRDFEEDTVHPLPHGPVIPL